VIERPARPNATLVGREDLALSLAVFRVRPDTRPPDGELWFEAGQHCGLAIASPAGGWLERPFSIASSPEDRRHLEFYIRRTSRSFDPFVERLWSLKAGSRVHVVPRFSGDLSIERTVGVGDPRLRVLVAAGTGLAPFVSILRRHARPGGGEGPGSFALLHGARTPDELAYRRELETLLDGRHRRYRPTVSRPEVDARWRGARGRVENHFDEARIPGLEDDLGLPPRGLTPERAVIFVCGFRGTIAGTIERLVQRGFAPAERSARDLLGVPEGTPPSLFFEYYDPEPLFDSHDLEAIERLRGAFPRGA
jgi:ferredoxin--NADP+ reductase